MGRRAPQTREDSSDLGGNMKKSLIALATAIATLGLVGQASTANAFLLKDRSPNVQAGQLIAGLGMSAGYFTQTRNRHFTPCPPFGSPRSLHWDCPTPGGCVAVR